jgi:hypothetical protein
MGRYHGIMVNIAEPSNEFLNWSPHHFSPDLAIYITSDSIVSFDAVKFYTRYEDHIFRAGDEQ